MEYVLVFIIHSLHQRWQKIQWISFIASSRCFYRWFSSPQQMLTCGKSWITRYPLAKEPTLEGTSNWSFCAWAYLSLCALPSASYPIRYRIFSPWLSTLIPTRRPFTQPPLFWACPTAASTPGFTAWQIIFTGKSSPAFCVRVRGTGFVQTAILIQLLEWPAWLLLQTIPNMRPDVRETL